MIQSTCSFFASAGIFAFKPVRYKMRYCKYASTHFYPAIRSSHQIW